MLTLYSISCIKSISKINSHEEKNVFFSDNFYPLLLLNCDLKTTDPVLIGHDCFYPL